MIDPTQQLNDYKRVDTDGDEEQYGTTPLAVGTCVEHNGAHDREQKCTNETGEHVMRIAVFHQQQRCARRDIGRHLTESGGHRAE